jgi:dTDP-4-dehydrorhamnose 3,5-epimerase
MKDIKIKPLAIPEVVSIGFGRLSDERGYFAETFKNSEFIKNGLTFFKDQEFGQANESFSKKGVMRGLHFQWNPYMGKLVRTVYGHMVDMVLDIRRGSPSYGKIVLHDMPSHSRDEGDQWIWVPVGFAHGNFFLEETLIEYFCTGEWSPGCEAGILPLAPDIDWSLCDKKAKDLFDQIVKATPLISEKDKNGLRVSQWTEDPRSENFIYKK